MKRLLFLLLTATLLINAMAQSDTTLSRTNPADSFRIKKPYQAWVRTADGKMIKGWLYQAGDDGVVLLNIRKNGIKNWPGLTARPATSINIPISQIQTIALRKKNSKWNGTLIGLGIGAVSGIVIGLASGDDPVQPYTNTFADVFIALNNAFAMTAGEKALAGAIGLGTTGAIVGFVISSIAKKKFVIGGKKQKVRDLQAELSHKLKMADANGNQ